MFEIEWNKTFQDAKKITHVFAVRQINENIKHMADKTQI